METAFDKSESLQTIARSRKLTADIVQKAANESPLAMDAFRVEQKITVIEMALKAFL